MANKMNTPIKLLAGNHPNVGTTGQGCFMNIAAYLNGDDQITEDSACVCATLRALLISLNDNADDERRQRLLPFMLRAMRSATESQSVISNRLTALVDYANWHHEYAADHFNIDRLAALDVQLAAEYALGALLAAKAFTKEFAAFPDRKAGLGASMSATECGEMAAAVAAAAYRAGSYTAIHAGLAVPGNSEGGARFNQYKKESSERGVALLDAVLPRAEPPSMAILARVTLMAKQAEAREHEANYCLETA